MRINFRLRFKQFTLFFMISHTQKLEGISSLSNREEKLHYPMWDIEYSTLNEVKENLKNLQIKYDLSDIYIMSDKEGSYRAICFCQVDFKTLCKILLDTHKLDYNFFYWTVQRGKATIRISNKLDRDDLKIIDVLENYYQPIPKQFEYVIYETGNDKIGKCIIIG